MDGINPESSRLWGPQVNCDGTTTFRLWAPSVSSLSIEFIEADGTTTQHPLMPTGGHWYESTFQRAPGTLYRYVMPDGLRVPDPASRFQPRDVHGPSEVINPTGYRWRNSACRRPWHQAIIYELHIGTFTAEGTFAAAALRLDHLVNLGITAIEIMPVADFTGGRNWGYDGALLYAPDSTYGRPEDLKALIDAAHDRGLMVFLDVVYNHFGPDGNYLSVYACDFFTDRHKTPWGAAINFDGAHAKPVREFFIGNALYWIHEYRLDGLRFDAVHSLVDDSELHLLDELAQRIRASAGGVHLIIENENNEAHRLARGAAGEPGLFTAQWNDDVHHVLHVAATGETQGYYVDYSPASGRLPRALAEGFAFQGEYMSFRGSARGEPSAHLPPLAFVSFIQNHDQIGNRAFGERLSTLAPESARKALAAVYLLAPQIPMLFMGEEWDAGQPFPFFCDFPGEIGQLVRQGRRNEFSKFPEFQDPTLRERIPDPQNPATFASAKLNWAELEKARHADWLEFYRHLIQVRRQAIEPLLSTIRTGARVVQEFEPGVVEIAWNAEEGRQLRLLANLTDRPCRYAPQDLEARTVFELGVAQQGVLAAYYVRWSLTTNLREAL